MRKIKPLLLIFFVLFVVYLPLGLASAQPSLQELNTLRITAKGTVDEKGNLKINLDWRFPTNALYIQIKKNFPSPYIILREFTSQKSAFEVANASIEYDDAERALHVTADFLGTAVNKKGRWEIDMGKGTDCILLEKQRGIFLQVTPIDSQMILVMDMMVSLPREAFNVRYNEKKGLLTYSLPRKSATGYCELDLSLQCKPRLMAATYKVYGNPDISGGSMWVAKAVFKNTGECNIRNLKVSYKLGEYSDWSIPHTYSLIVPGGYVVDLYYPVISSKVTQLLTRTPVDVQIKYSYQDEEGNKYEDISGERIEILGINQIEFCNLTKEEITGTWAEYFSNAPLLAAWVTHLDPPVKALAGMVSRLAGGVPTKLDQESAIKFCRTLYDLEVANGLAYQTPSGFLVEYMAGQDIKYPRDVLRDKSGTCVDLAILYASVCEAVGLETMLILIPGHCFPVVVLPGGGLLPVECTAISGAAVGGPQGQVLSFDKAVELASKELQNLQMGKYYSVNVEEMWQQGLVSPELPRLEADVLEKWGWRLPQAQIQQRQQQAAGGRQGKRTGGGQTTTTFTKRYSSEQYRFSFDYPQDWKVQEAQGSVSVIHPQNLAWITVWRIVENIDPQTFLQNIEFQLEQQYRNFAVISRKQATINGVNVFIVIAESTSPQGQAQINGILVFYENNQAKLGVVSAGLRGQYDNLSPMLDQIIGSITLW
ncbi:MAG TPA: transglutaminase domain-containing protein [Candidatus Aerophobetes bacterium]|uniref:Transglutaminase domain-containing protein n=1 Tax=Aerophobetes bacterium TaxID=2030807 RepID=A0A7V0QS43_UNCAE|nr:transglutaminase domain-containing protein [Candidatus Aerophobetes bacterium]